LHYIAAGPALHGWLYSTFDPPNWVRAVLYAALWMIVLAGVFVFFVWAPRRRRENRWTTQDIFALAILSVLLLVWDTFLNDQLFGPIVSAIPVAGNFLNWMQLADLPYIFIVMVAVATIRKPGTVTALIFIKRLVGEIMYATHGVNVPIWPDALDEGVFADLFIMWRGEALLSTRTAWLIDGFVIGFMRGAPNLVFDHMVLDPFLNGSVHTWASIIGTNLAGGGGVLGNGIGDGVEAAITAGLAVQVAKSLGIIYGRGRVTGRDPQPVLATTALAAEGAGAGGLSGSAAASQAAPAQDAGAWHAIGQDDGGTGAEEGR
jgi:hypothetical protein